MKKKVKFDSNKKILLSLSVLVAVAVSGCVSFGNIFGPGEQEVEAPSDVMVFSDATVIPNPPILTGDTFTTSFAIKNLDEFDEAGDVRLELYDWGVCEPSSCTPVKGVCSQTFGSIFPKDVRQIEYQFKAPSSERIGGMEAKCPVRYKLTYDFSGITTTELNVISNQKFQEMQRAGQTPSVVPTQSKSRGPIKVDFSFGVNQPVRTSNKTAGNLVKIPMYIRVENKGSGKANIETNEGLIILIPVIFSEKKNDCSGIICNDFEPGWYVPATDSCKFFELKHASKKIEFVKDKSQVFRCELTSPDESVVPEQKTYSIQSIVKYTYQIDNDFSVAIKPMTFG